MPRHFNKGKLFCAELEIAKVSDVPQHMTVHVWLCDGCAMQMKPDSQVAGEVIRLLLAQFYNPSAPYSPTVN
jgi:hypothetical protein